MWKVTRRELRAHKLRFLLTAVAVVLGVAFISGTFVFTATIQRTFDDLFTNIYAGTDAQVRGPEVLKNDNGFGASQRPRIPEALLAIVRSAPGVQGAEGNVQLDYAQIVKANGKAIGTPGQGAPTLGFGWNPDERLNQFHLTAGGHAPANADEIVIDRGTAKKGDFKVGQRAKVLTNQAPKEYTIVGIARFGSADNLAGASVVLFTIPEAQRIAGAQNQFDYINVAARSGVSQTEVADSVRNTLATAPLPNRSARPDVEVITGKALVKENQDDIHKVLGFLNTGLLIFGIVALAVGAFIIYNTFTIIVAQRTREMALLRAIGASRRQVLTSIVGESLIVGVVASAIGVLAGIGLAIGLKALTGALGIDLPGSGTVVPSKAIIVGMTVGVVITLLSALIPARTGARVPPIAAMREVAVERAVSRSRRLLIGGGIGALGLALLLFVAFGSGSMILFIPGAIAVFAGIFVLGPLFAREVSLAIGKPVARAAGHYRRARRENAARNPRRTATTALALMIGVALIAFIAIFAASAKSSFSRAIDAQIKSDYVINSGGSFGGTGLSPELGRQVAQLPEVQASTPLRIGQFGVNGGTELVGAVEPKAAQQLFDLDMVAGSLDQLTPDGLVVSEKTATKHNWTVGTEVPATFVKNAGKPKNLMVQGIYGVKNIALPVNYIMSIAGFEQNFDNQLDVLVYATLKPGVTAEQGAAAIEPLLANYPTAKLQDNASYKADQEKNLNQLLGLIYALLLLAVVIAFIGVVNTLALSIYERTREIGLLRAVGMSRKQVRSSIRWEAVFIALFGTVLGIVVGLFFGWSVVRALADDGLNKFSPAISTLIVLVVTAAILGVVSAILPARRAAKLDVLRAVSSE